MASLIVTSCILVGAIGMVFMASGMLTAPIVTSAGLFPLIVAVAMVVVAGLIVIGDIGNA